MKNRNRTIQYIFIFFIIILVLFSWTVFAQDQTQSEPPKPPFNPYTSFVDLFSQWCIPLIIFGIAFYAYAVKKVKVYEVFVEGAREGFNVAIRIIPYLVAILFTIGMFRAGGAESIFIKIVTPVTNIFRVPPSVLPLFFIRPLSGSGARAVMIDIFNHYGPDSLDGLIASCVQGSTETTFYVIAVYLGSIGVRNSRYAIPACLFGDLCGMIASVVICIFWPWPF